MNELTQEQLDVLSNLRDTQLVLIWIDLFSPNEQTPSITTLELIFNEKFKHMPSPMALKKYLEEIPKVKDWIAIKDKTLFQLMEEEFKIKNQIFESEDRGSK